MPGSYRIEFTPRAARDFRALTKAIQRRIAVRIDGLATDPRPAGVRKLEGAEDVYRIRAGDYRIVYQVRDAVLLVLIVRVGHRKDVYR